MERHIPDPYQVLHVGPSATPREVARAFRALVRSRHPDTSVAEAPPGTPGSTAQELREIMEAYALLRDPARRAAYDKQRATPTPPAVARPAKARTHAPAGPITGPVLIIGPVRWESSPARARHPQGGRSRDPFNPWWLRR